MLRLWLATETAPVRRSEIRILMARTMRQRGMFAAARNVLREALEETPKNPLVERSLGLELFRAGEIRTGLELYDSGRWQLPSFEKYQRAYPFPTWAGEDPAGRHILLWAEQGIGDQIMQMRAVVALLKAGARVTVEADPRLEEFLTALSPDIAFLPQMVEMDEGIVASDIDFQISMLSAWRFLDDPLAHGDWIRADRRLTARYRAAWRKLGKGMNVGLSWQSSAATSGAVRSVPLEELRPLTLCRPACFHNLQYGEVDIAAAGRAFGAPLLTDPACDPLRDLRRQAAQIAALDLVITVDNATAHLAGALGKPVWILLPKESDWRWGSLAKPCRLYPGQRLFRANDADDWSAPLWALFEAFCDDASG